jgi:hypothetical protein
LGRTAERSEAHENVTDFLLYYGVLGIVSGDNEYFIFTVNYDLKVLKIRAERRRGRRTIHSEPSFLACVRIS